jgi:hypothetical protein
MSAPPGFNPDTSLLQQNASAPIVPFRGGGTPLSLDAFYQAILKGQPETIRKALPESIADITSFAISVEDGKFVLKMKVKGKKKGAADEIEEAADIAAVEALQAANEANETEKAIAAVAASEAAAKAEAEEAKKKEEEEILKQAREFLILEAARVFLRTVENNEDELPSSSQFVPGPSSSQLVTGPSKKNSYANKRARLNKAVQGVQEDETSSVRGVIDPNDRQESNFDDNIKLGDLSEVDRVIREYEDATNNPPNLNDRKTKQIKILRRALTVIDAARQFAKVGAIGKKRKIAQGKQQDKLQPFKRERRFTQMRAPTSQSSSSASSSSASSASASSANVENASRVQAQLVKALNSDPKSTVTRTGEKKAKTLNPLNPAQKPQ